MRLSKRDIRVLIVIGFIVGFSMVALGAVFDTATPTSGKVPLVTNDGANITISGTTNVSLDDGSIWSDDTVIVRTTDGNLTVSSTGPANATVNANDITGTYTNATQLDVSSNQMTLDPEDKPQVTLQGAATEAAWTDYALDDGTVDMVISGPDATSTDVTFYGLTPDVRVSAVNKSTGNPVAVGETNADGNVTLNIGHSTQTILLKTGDQSSFPVLSNPSPTGDLSDEPNQLSIQVNDSDFPDDDVTVNISLDGTQQTSTTLQSNGTVTASVPNNLDAGVHNWTVNATDKFGNSEEETYSFTVPGFVYIFNETPNSTGQHELLDGVNITVEATTTGSGGTAFKTNVKDGIINLTGLDPGQTYIITLDAQDYYVRSVYLPDLYSQNSVFLLNKSINSTTNTITLDDATGRYSDNPVLVTQRVVNTSNATNIPDDGYRWVTIGGDRLGADNQFVAHFEQDERYRFKVINQDGDTRILGEYTAELDGPINLEVGTVNYRFGDEEQGYVWTALVQNETTGGSVRFAFTDYEELTEELILTIKTRDTGTVVTSERFTSGPYGEIVYVEPITQSEYENTTYNVSFVAERGDGQISGSKLVGSRQTLTFPISDIWRHVIYAAVTFLLAFTVGVGISAGAGAITVALWSGVAWFVGIVPQELGAGAIILALLIGIWTTTQEQDPRVPG